MLNKRITAVVMFGIVSISLFLITGCSKEKKKDVFVTNKKSSNIVINPSNIVINPSFEDGIIFDSGIYEEGKSPTSKPVGWTTEGQILDDSSAWTADEAHSGKRSLKINNIGGSKAYWSSGAIALAENINTLKVSIWTKTKDLQSENEGGQFALLLDVYLKVDGDNEIIKKVILDIPQTNHDWLQTSQKYLFKENIIKIIPRVCFTDNIGIVYIDDLEINPIDTSNGIKTLFDSNVEESLTGNFDVVAENDKDNVFKATGSQKIISSDFLAVEHNKMYKMSGMFKSAEEKSLLYFGYLPYTKDKEFITPQSVKFLAKTETELAKACEKGDTVIYIKDGSNWVADADTKPVYVAFDTDNSGSMSDLPNFNLSKIKIDGIEKDEDSWKIFLVEPCANNYPENTKIREHIMGGYEYIVACHAPAEWTEYKEIITFKPEFIPEGRIFPPGTSFIKINILANLGQSSEVLLLKNISLGENNIP